MLSIAILAILTIASGCDQLKGAYCTNVVPLLNKPCSQSTPAPVPLAEVK